MPKLLAIASTLTTLAVLAISGTAFASDHRHGATAAAQTAPPKVLAATNVAVQGARKGGYHPRRGLAGGSSVPTPGKTTQQK